MNGDGWIEAPMWEEWRALTRLQWSGSIAFDAEIEARISTSSNPREDDVERLEAGGRYRTSVENHVATLTDRGLFHALLLLRSHALLESHAKLIRHMLDEQDWSPISGAPSESLLDEIEEKQLRGGVAVWSNDLVRRTGQSWAMVYGEASGLIEVSIVRNAIAHGHRRCGPRLRRLFHDAGIACPFAEGEELRLSFERLHEYRGRIRSFCRVIGDGAIHLARGTHRSPPT